MQKVQWHYKSDLWWQSWNWKGEKWPAFRFPISPPPTDATLKISLHFLHLWSVGQKSFLSDFEKMVYWPNYRPKGPQVAIKASFLWGNLKPWISLVSISQAYTSKRRILIQVLPVPNAYTKPGDAYIHYCILRRLRCSPNRCTSR